MKRYNKFEKMNKVKTSEVDAIFQQIHDLMDEADLPVDMKIDGVYAYVYYPRKLINKVKDFLSNKEAVCFATLCFKIKKWNDDNPTIFIVNSNKKLVKESESPEDTVKILSKLYYQTLGIEEPKKLTIYDITKELEEKKEARYFNYLNRRDSFFESDYIRNNRNYRNSNRVLRRDELFGGVVGRVNSSKKDAIAVAKKLNNASDDNLVFNVEDTKDNIFLLKASFEYDEDVYTITIEEGDSKQKMMMTLSKGKKTLATLDKMRVSQLSMDKVMELLEQAKIDINSIEYVGAAKDKQAKELQKRLKQQEDEENEKKRKKQQEEDKLNQKLLDVANEFFDLLEDVKESLESNKEIKFTKEDEKIIKTYLDCYIKYFYEFSSFLNKAYRNHDLGGWDWMGEIEIKTKGTGRIKEIYSYENNDVAFNLNISPDGGLLIVNTQESGWGKNYKGSKRL